jgi:hypothetical protein
MIGLHDNKMTVLQRSDGHATSTVSTTNYLSLIRLHALKEIIHHTVEIERFITVIVRIRAQLMIGPIFEGLETLDCTILVTALDWSCLPAIRGAPR